MSSNNAEVASPGSGGGIGSGFNYGAVLAKLSPTNASNGSVQITVNDESAKLIASQVGNSAVAMAQNEVERMKNLARELRDGPFSVRLASYAGGIIMVVTGFMSFVSNFFSLSAIGCLIQIYIFVFGWMIVFIEARSNMLPVHIMNGIYEYAKFMTVVWGRGGFYFFCGTLAFCQWNLLDILLGMYMMALGGGMVYWGRQAIQKLRKMKGHWESEADLKKHFMEHDKDNSGALDPKELAEMCKSLGAEMSVSELETCILMLDQNHDGNICFAEFLHWYNNDTSIVYGIIE